MKNIVLIGMPGCGKSTIGVLLAKSMLMDFADTDLIIQKKYSQSLCEIIEEKGIESFISAENRIIADSVFTSSVIATGGSAVYGEEAMEHLRSDSIIIYLDTPVSELKKRIGNIKTRGVVIRKGSTLEDLFTERKPLYEKYADIKISCGEFSTEECVEKIVDIIREYK